MVRKQTIMIHTFSLFFLTNRSLFYITMFYKGTIMTDLTDTLGLILIVVIPIILLIFLLKQLPSKGAIGEKRVAHILKKLPEDKYKVINNILIQNNGYTTQIDHIVISIYGIFVIETKTYQGWIYGGENSDYWTQNIYGHKYQLRNPIHQNYGHIKTIKNILQEYPGLPYISIVAFSRQASLGVSSKTPVIYWNQILPVIYQFENRVLTERQVEMLANLITASNLDSKETRKEHKKTVRSNIQKRKETIKSGKCTRCGGTLVRRQGKYGSFYGCSNYPKCKYILK